MREQCDSLRIYEDKVLRCQRRDGHLYRHHADMSLEVGYTTIFWNDDRAATREEAALVLLENLFEWSWIVNNCLNGERILSEHVQDFLDKMQDKLLSVKETGVLNE